MDSRPSSAARVFSIVELFEAIALHLPLKDLLFAQHVCKNWKDNIEGSKVFRRALFFEPVSTGVAFFYEKRVLHWSLDHVNSKSHTVDGRTEDVSCLRLCGSDDVSDILHYCHHRPSWREAAEPAKYDRATSDHLRNFYWTQADDRLSDTVVDGYWAGRQNAESAKEIQVFLNPLLISRFEWYRTFFLTDSSFRPSCFYKLDLEDNTDLKRPAQRPEASWRRMLATQPPLGFVDSTHRNWTRGGEKSSYVSLCPEGGWPTMDALRIALAPSAYCDFAVNGIDGLVLWTDGMNLQWFAAALRKAQKEGGEEDAIINHGYEIATELQVMALG